MSTQGRKKKVNRFLKSFSKTYESRLAKNVYHTKKRLGYYNILKELDILNEQIEQGMVDKASKSNRKLYR